MSNNPSYNFLNKHGKLFHLPVTLKTSKKKEKYALIPLPTQAKEKVMQYPILEQHISIYEKIRPTFGTYHYTTTLWFKGKEARLHVYFNEKDQLVHGPILEDNEGFPIALQPAQTEAFVQMALRQSMPAMAALREGRLSLSTQLSASLKAEKAQIFALPTNTLQELNTCFEAIEQQLPKATDLKELDASSTDLDELTRYQQSIGWQISDLPVVPTPVSGKLPEVPTIATPPSAPVAILPTKPIKPTTATVSVPAATSSFDMEILQSNIQKLHGLKAACAQDSDNPEQLAAYYDMAQQALGSTLECPKHINITADLAFIFTALEESKTLCVRRLTQDVIQNSTLNFELLRGFIPFLSDSTLAFAIKQENDNLLKILLDSKDFPVNHILHKGMPLLELALQSKTPACFKLLLEYGACGLARGSDGYPIVHKAMLNRINNPFYTIAKAHYAEVPGGLKRFFKCLNALLLDQLEKANLSETERDQIERSIAEHREAIDVFAVTNNSTWERRQASSVARSRDQFFSSLPPETLDTVGQVVNNPILQHHQTQLALTQKGSSPASIHELMQPLQPPQLEGNELTPALVEELTAKQIAQTARQTRMVKLKQTIEKHAKAYPNAKKIPKDIKRAQKELADLVKAGKEESTKVSDDIKASKEESKQYLRDSKLLQGEADKFREAAELLRTFQDALSGLQTALDKLSPEEVIDQTDALDEEDNSDVDDSFSNQPS